jgi:hemolysin D
VRPGDPLIVIVPADAPIAIEAQVLNKDIGFVSEGQSATVKIEAFPFTRYGSVDGQVVSGSDDAISGEHLSLAYAVRVHLAQVEMNIDGRRVALSSGMGASVEVKTGRRAVMEFLLSPIVQRVRESLQER